jgi:hypothetical protein
VARGGWVAPVLALTLALALWVLGAAAPWARRLLLRLLLLLCGRKRGDRWAGEWVDGGVNVVIGGDEQTHSWPPNELERRGCVLSVV